MCIIPSCFDRAASYTFATSGSDTKTFIRSHHSILVSGRELIRITLILPICAFPFPINISICASQEQFLLNLHAEGMCTDPQSLIPLLTTCTRSFPRYPLVRYVQQLGIFHVRSLFIPKCILAPSLLDSATRMVCPKPPRINRRAPILTLGLPLPRPVAFVLLVLSCNY